VLRQRADRRSGDEAASSRLIPPPNGPRGPHASQLPARRQEQEQVAEGAEGARVALRERQLS
jgi:hypothetical protein